VLKQVIEQLINGEDLTHDVCEKVIHEMISGRNESQMAAFLVLMRQKGETADELFGIVKAMRQKMIPVPVEIPVLDIVGTGGDQSHSVNISTGASILAAACGVKVAKHGNRASSSKCGSADVLEAMGLPIELGPDKVKEALDQFNIGFMFAPFYHPVFKEIAKVRKQLGIRTLFNFIGPLLNPAIPPFHLFGVARSELIDLLADVLLLLKTKRALIFHCEGLDELTPVGPCDIVEVSEGKKIRFTLDPKDLGFERCTKKDLEGDDPKLNARLLLEAFQGKPGPIADTLILNAGVAVYVYGLANSIEEGIEKAREVQQTGKAMEVIEKWKTF
jgi:anthranilate phosphoribosyltransferase